LSRITEFDGLRAIAVALVVLFHAKTGLAGGYIGVDIFFVLSGYLITTLLVAEHNATGRISLLRFYMRRACRLTPALWLMIATAVIIVWLILKENMSRSHFDAISAAGLYYMNWYRAEYRPEWILGHTWSVAVEEQFYLVWPPILVIALYFRPQSARWIAAVLLIASTVTWTIFVMRDISAWRIYAGSDTRSSELFVGCLLALWPPSVKVSTFAAKFVCVPLIVLAVTSLTLEWSTGFMICGGFHLVALLTAWLLIAIRAGSPFNVVLRHPALVYIGRISYGIYLWHYPILALLYSHGVNAVAAASVGIPLSVAFASMSFFLMERRILRFSAAHFSIRPNKSELPTINGYAARLN
jgi:peptidoglycan/LPS O-acetylase OafA/YrhL